MCFQPRKGEGSAGARWQSPAEAEVPPDRGGPCLSGSGSQCEVTRLLCLQSELKVQEVFRNEVTGGTRRIFFSVSVETYSELGSSAWWDV